MSEERINKLYLKGESLLSRAHNELYKPKGDVVKYSACISARSALYYFLSCLYLYHDGKDEKGEIEDGSKTIEELIDYVGDYHEGISDIDFSQMRCKYKDIEDVVSNDEIYFCNNTEIINTCTELADQTRELVINNAFGGNAPKITQH